MDLDISDILADIHSPEPLSQSHLTSTAYIDHQQLTRLWTWERTCLDILPWPTELMQRVMARVRAQITRIEVLAAAIVPPNLSGSTGRSLGNHTFNLTLSILH